MAKKKVKHSHHEDHSGLFIPAGLFLGLGVGGYYGSYGVGVLIGLGVGFLAMAISRSMKR